MRDVGEGIPEAFLRRSCYFCETLNYKFRGKQSQEDSNLPYVVSVAHAPARSNSSNYASLNFEERDDGLLLSGGISGAPRPPTNIGAQMWPIAVPVLVILFANSLLRCLDLELVLNSVNTLPHSSKVHF